MKKFHWPVLLLSSFPLCVWSLAGISNDLAYSWAHIPFFVVFVSLVILVNRPHAKYKWAFLVPLLIIVMVLGIEGLHNDMFGPLYPPFLILLVTYYVILALWQMHWLKKQV